MTRQRRTARSQAETGAAEELINILAAAAFDDLPELPGPTPDEVEALLDAIMLGALDQYLEHLSTVLTIRRDMIAGVTELIARGKFKVGDRIRFSDTAKPRYLSGRVGTITNVAMQRLVVQLDEPVGRYANGEVKTRATQIELFGPE